MEYEKIIQAIKSAPVTQLPAIMFETIKVVCKKDVFISEEVLKNTISKIIINASSSKNLDQFISPSKWKQIRKRIKQYEEINED